MPQESSFLQQVKEGTATGLSEGIKALYTAKLHIWFFFLLMAALLFPDVFAYLDWPRWRTPAQIHDAVIDGFLTLIAFVLVFPPSNYRGL